MKKILCFLAVAVLAISALSAENLYESFGGDFPPQGWRVINGGSTASTWVRTSGWANSGNTSAYLQPTINTYDDWLVTPQMLPKLGVSTFRFYVRNIGGNPHFDLMISKGPNNAVDFTTTLAANVTSTQTWTEYTYNLSAYLYQYIYVAFRVTLNEGYPICIDDVHGPQLACKDGFETCNFSSFEWNNSSSNPWFTQPLEKSNGIYAAQSGSIGDNSGSVISLERYGELGGNITFYQKVSSQAGSDWLKFYIDGVEKGAWSGEGAWTAQSYNVPAGNHTYLWIYCTDAAGSGGSNCAWIDDVYFPLSIPGSPESPYLIYNFDQLNNMRYLLGSAYATKYFKLMNNIDATPTQTSTWVPIGSSGTSSAFYGSFDGNNHTISNLRVSNYGNYHGLFGYTAAGSSIKNFSMNSSCYILGDFESGSIVGHNDGTVDNCRSAATVNIGNATKGGGIVGDNYGTISNCIFSGTVSRSGSGVAASSLGGIVGKNESAGIVTNCYSTGSINGNLWNGGVAGWNDGTIDNCYSKGTVACNDNSNGGLVGQNNGSIANCFSQANVSGAHYLGGLVGNHGGGSVTNCYSTGTVTGGTKGGLIGALTGTVNSSYWDTQTSGLATSFGGVGKTTALMKTQSTYSGWDFYGETANGSNDYWALFPSDNGGYPLLMPISSRDVLAPLPWYPADGSIISLSHNPSISWDYNHLGQVPTSYAVFSINGNPAHIMETGYPGQVTSLPSEIGMYYTENYYIYQNVTFHSSEVWYYVVVAYNAFGEGAASPVRSFVMAYDPWVTEGFENGNTDGSTSIAQWAMISGSDPVPWVANSTHTDYNRSPRTGAFNITLNNPGSQSVNTSLSHNYPLTAGKTYEIELYARQDTSNPLNATLKFQMQQYPSPTLIDLSPAYQLTNGAYQRITCYFTTPQLDSYYVYLNGAMLPGVHAISVDDISIREITALDTPEIAISSTDNEITLNWNEIAHASEYRVYAADSPDSWTNYTVVSAPTHTYTCSMASSGPKFFKVVASSVISRVANDPINTKNKQ